MLVIHHTALHCQYSYVSIMYFFLIYKNHLETMDFSTIGRAIDCFVQDHITVNSDIAVIMKNENYENHPLI